MSCITEAHVHVQVGQASAMSSSSSSSMMRPGTGPFASGRMTPEPGLPYIKAAAAAAQIPTRDAAAPSTSTAAAAHADPGSTATESLPMRHESGSSRRSMHAHEENTASQASLDASRHAGKVSARQPRPLRSARGNSALALALSPATALDTDGSGPPSARLTALPLPPQTQLSTVEEPVSRERTGPSHATSSNERSTMRPVPPSAAASQLRPAAPASDGGDSSDESVYRSSSSHSSNRMYNMKKRSVHGAARGRHRRRSSLASTPVMYELETMLGGTGTTATHHSQPGSFLQPLGGPPANMSYAGSTAADSERPLRRSGLSTQHSTSEDLKAGAARGPVHGEGRGGSSLAPPAAAAHVTSEHGSVVSDGAADTAAAAADAATADDSSGRAAQRDAVPAVSRSFARKLLAARAASSASQGAGPGTGGRPEESRQVAAGGGSPRHRLMSRTLGLHTRDSIYCMGPEPGTPTHHGHVRALALDSDYITEGCCMRAHGIPDLLMYGAARHGQRAHVASGCAAPPPPFGTPPCLP